MRTSRGVSGQPELYGFGREGAKRTRHIDIRYYWLKERVTNGDAVVKHVGTVDIHANMLTKPPHGQQFINEREGLTVKELTVTA